MVRPYTTDAYHPKGRGFDSRFSRHVGTFGKCFARSSLWHFTCETPTGPTQYPCCVWSAFE